MGGTCREWCDAPKKAMTKGSAAPRRCWAAADNKNYSDRTLGRRLGGQRATSTLLLLAAAAAATTCRGQRW